MIIKNNQGDWGVLLGCWVERKPAQTKGKTHSYPSVVFHQLHLCSNCNNP